MSYHDDLMKRMTDEAVPFKHVREFGEWLQIQSDLILRRRTSEIVCGPAGRGKSYNFEHGGKYHGKCLYFGARATHCESFKRIATMVAMTPPEKHPLIVFNDVGGMLGDKGMISMQQQAMSQRPLTVGRNLTYTSGAVEQEKQSIICHSPVLTILNEIPASLRETVYSLITRAGKVTIFDPPPDEMHRFMRRWAKDDDQKVIYDFIGASIADGLIRRHHLRWYDALLHEMNAGNCDWRRWAVEQWLQLGAPSPLAGRRDENERGKMKVVARLLPLDLPKPDLYARYEAECVVAGITGGSQRDCYYAIEKYQKLMRAGTAQQVNLQICKKYKAVKKAKKIPKEEHERIKKVFE